MVEKSYRGSSMDEDKLERLVYKVVDHPSLNQFSVCLFSSISHKSSIWSLFRFHLRCGESVKCASIIEIELHHLSLESILLLGYFLLWIFCVNQNHIAKGLP